MKPASHTIGAHALTKLCNSHQAGSGHLRQSKGVNSSHLQYQLFEWAGLTAQKSVPIAGAHRTGELLITACQPVNQPAPSASAGNCNLTPVISITATPAQNFSLAEVKTEIHYRFIATPFGEIIAASSPKGIFYCHFVNKRDNAISELRHFLPDVECREHNSPALQEVEQFFQQPGTPPHKLHLHLTGTPFQLTVWQALLRIPAGELKTYGEVAKSIHKPKAARAVGTAIGQNSIAVLIPCHRVIKASGHLGNYRWGEKRKAALLDWENNKTL